MSDSFESSLQAALASRYLLERKLGGGGMGEVWLAKDLTRRGPVAIKVLRPELVALMGRERFILEIEIAARLTHPHILPLFDSGETGGFLYFTMPYAAGGSLRDRLAREKQLPVEDALRLACELADGLDYAHRQGVVHRDLKPENILLEERHAVIADFGIARAVDLAAGGRLTETGVVLGTPAYMSPEQAAGSSDVDGRSDIYGLACLTYELLAGQAPFTGPTPFSILGQHLNVRPRPVDELRSTVSPSVVEALTRALAKVPADRFACAADFAAALVPLAAQPEPVRTIAPDPPAERDTAPITPYPAPKPPRNARRWVMLVPALFLTLGAITVWKWPSLLPGCAPPTPHGGPPKAAMMIADFEGPPDDPDLPKSMRELIRAGLDQSDLVRTVPPDQVREVLRQAGKPDTTRLTPELAREIAFRSSVRTVLAGQLHRLGDGYSIIVRLVDVEKDSTLFTLDQSARSENDLVPAADRLTGRLRTLLGERRESIRATRRMNPVATPSFEALRKFVRAREMLWHGRFPENHHVALQLIREALVLDPDFADAYLTMGEAMANLQMADSAKWAFDQAARRPERLSEVKRLMLGSTLAAQRGDFTAAMNANDLILARDSTLASAWNRRATLYSRIGPIEEAVRSAEEAVRLQVFAPNEILLHNLFVLSVAAGDGSRASAALDRLRANNATREYGPAWLALLQGAYPRAESLAATIVADPRKAKWSRWQAVRLQIGGAAARGHVTEAVRLLALARAIHQAGGGAEPGRLEERNQVLLAHLGGMDLLPETPQLGRDTTAALISMGLRSACLGDTAAARRTLARLRARSQPDLVGHGAGPSIVEAFLALQVGDWSGAVRILQPLAREDNEWGPVRDPVGRQWPRWLMAEAWEQLGNADSAATYYELATSRGKTVWFGEARMVSSFAHHRLVLLYARAGRLPEAERHWRILRESWTHPDARVRRMLAEAGTALMSARAMVGVN